MRHAARSTAPVAGFRRLLLLAGLLLAACGAAPKAESEFLAAVAPGTFDGYAWLDDAANSSVDAALDAEVRQAVDAELARIGQPRVPLAEADLIVSYSTSTELVNIESDAYVTGHVAEQHEIGTLTIELLSVDSGETLWRGSTEEKLRVSAVLYGGVSSTQFAPTDSTPVWNVRERVEATIAQLAGRL